MDGDERFMQDTIDLNRHRVFKTDTMINPKTRAIYDYWEALRAGRVAPMRSDVDPRKMPCDVRNVFILEMISSGNIRFRVAGSALVDAFGTELRGMNARSIMAPESRESCSALLNETLEDPGVGYARLIPSESPDAAWEISLLPLRSDYGAVDRLMGVLIPVGRHSRRHPGALQFRIDTMHVDTINPTVLDAGHAAPAPAPGFAESTPPFATGSDRNGLADAPRRRGPDLQAIDGGLERPETAGPRNTGHLRLVDDEQ